MAIPEVPEDSAYDMDVALFNSDGLPEAPNALWYRIDDIKTGQPIREKEAIGTPTEVTTVSLLPVDTVILDQDNTSEIRRITFTAEYGGATDIYNFEVDYEVKNLLFLD